MVNTCNLDTVLHTMSISDVTNTSVSKYDDDNDGDIEIVVTNNCKY